MLDETETDDPALVGEMAHMVAESEDGPRGVSPLTPEQRDLYGNLILLCRNHHGEIDRQPATWPVERLHQIKADHETWVRQSLPGFDALKQRDEETYAGYIDEWSKRCHLEEWTAWTSAVLSNGQPSLDVAVSEDLFELGRWTLKRIWPGRYPSLEAAMQNFARVLQDFLRVFNKHAEKPFAEADEIWTKKFYAIEEWNPELYHRLARQYDHHVDLVQDLILELTRAANLVCDQVRAHLLSSYRIREGRLSIRSGPHSDMTWREVVVKYNEKERAAVPPYPGLDAFLIARATRDMNFGDSSAPD
ncbi:hypothetical protein [Mesorhizobium sp. M0140]|uniref:hypothetical protein n=1 Tax=Mesorhizobium sp. M0140 TaxID=2956893 RepID=UPI00333BD131